MDHSSVKSWFLTLVQEADKSLGDICPIKTDYINKMLDMLGN